MDSNSYPEFGQGLEGYGQYFWHTLADTADENFLVGGVGPILFHQDNRFYTLGHGSFGKRSWYAVTRVLVTRTDNGNKMFNFSEIVGSGAAAGLSTALLPQAVSDLDQGRPEVAHQRPHRLLQLLVERVVAHRQQIRLPHPLALS